MKTGRQALEQIKAQVKTIRDLQDKAEGTLVRAKKKLTKLIKTFPRAEKELYKERINQITKRYL